MNRKWYIVSNDVAMEIEHNVLTLTGGAPDRLAHWISASTTLFMAPPRTAESIFTLAESADHAVSLASLYKEGKALLEASYCPECGQQHQTLVPIANT